MLEFIAMTTALPQANQVENGVIREYPLERRYYYTDYKDAVLLEDFREKKVKKLKSQDIKVALNKEKQESKQNYCINEKTVVVYFDFDKYNLKPFEKEKIDKAFSKLKDKKDLKVYKVYVSGYTDNVGTKAYNDILACKRAKTVQDYIKKKYTKNVYIEQAEGKCCYLSKKIQKLNRRAEIKIQYKDKCEK